MKSFFSPFILMSVMLIASSSCRNKNSNPALLCYVGGTMRPVMEELAKNYQDETGQAVEIDYAGSGELLIKIQQTKMGDVYVCHDPFLAAADLKSLVIDGWTLASVSPVIVVPKGNPKHITGFRDLAKPGIRLVLSHKEYSTAGHLVTRMVANTGLNNLTSNIVSRTRGGGGAANAVMLGTADAAIVWNAAAFLRKEKLDIIPIEPGCKLQRGVDAVTTATFKRIDMDYIRVTAATLTTSKQPATAKAFGEYIASDKNRSVWDAYGFSPADHTRPHPALVQNPDIRKTLLVHCAAGMRLPVSEMAKKFERLSGTNIEMSYDGSNRLLGQIELTRKGDVYIAGDTDYIETAKKKGLVETEGVLCYFVPVILTRKGNPKQISSLADLMARGIRIGQGDELSAAVGRLTMKLLDLNGINKELWKRNVVMTTPTVNELAIAIKLATVDAAVVWDAIASKYSADSEIVTLPPNKNICPAVGAAVLTLSKNKDVAQAFLNFMLSNDGKEILQKNGYTVDAQNKQKQ